MNRTNMKGILLVAIISLWKAADARRGTASLSDTEENTSSHLHEFTSRWRPQTSIKTGMSSGIPRVIPLSKSAAGTQLSDSYRRIAAMADVDGLLQATEPLLEDGRHQSRSPTIPVPQTRCALTGVNHQITCVGKPQRAPGFAPGEILQFLSAFMQEESQIVHASALTRAKRQADLPATAERTSRFTFQRDNAERIADESLGGLIRTIVERDMNDCDLIIAFDRSFVKSRALETLSSIPVSKQVVHIETSKDLALQVDWPSGRCQGTFLLVSEAEPLLEFGNDYNLKFHWAYGAKVVIVGLSVENLDLFAKTMKGKKTEHIVGIVGDASRHSLFKIYMNLLLWGEGVTQIAEWMGHKLSKNVDLFPDKISNIQNNVIRVLVFEWQPAIFYHRDASGKLLLRYGRDTVVVKTLAEVFNFTLVYVEVPSDELFGYLLPNGTFCGLVGYLGRDLGDMGIANLYTSGIEDRHKFQDYSTHFSEDQGCFLGRVDPPLPRWQNPTLPFTTSTWIAFLVGFVISGPILYLLSIFSAQRGEETGYFKSFEGSCFYVYGLHVYHPLNFMPKRATGQIFVLTLSVYTIVITTGYQANLMSFLTVARQPKSVETFKDLYDSPLTIKSIPYFVEPLQQAQNPFLRALLDRYVIRLTFDELKDEILEGKIVTINSRVYLESFGALIRTKRGKPLVRLLKECFSSYSVGLGFPVNSPLKAKFNQAIARMFESGMVRVWFNQANEYYRKLKKQAGEVKEYPDNSYDSTDGVIPLGMDHMQGIFVVVTLGYIVAAIVFGLEVLIRRIRMRNST